MAKINVLPKHLTELIAAGEVVERPAAVVKELAENSIDAGAKSITIEIKNGGVAMIRITDDGSGIERSEIRKAFISHATSKIENENDLDRIFTLGFRGEALASIASVSRVDLMTKTQADEIGSRIVIEGGEEILLDDAGCPNGTTIIVRDIFYNVPARMKFLKKDVTEGNYVAAVVDRIALSHPEVSVRFIRDGKQTMMTPGNSKLIDTIYSVFGKDFADSLIETNYSLDGVKLTGYVSKPFASRPSRNMQFFFLNSRYIQTKTGFAALEQAYKNSVMTGKYPACILNIEIDPGLVDVNVHPAKTEVRFTNEKLIFNAVYYGVQSVLSARDVRPQVKVPISTYKSAFETQAPVEQIKLPERNENFWSNQTSKSYKNETQREAKTLPSANVISDASQHKINTHDDDLITEAIKRVQIKEETQQIPKQSETLPEKPAGVHTKEIEKFRIVGELFKTYILAETDDKVLVIDKHAAHERILFEKFKKEQNGDLQILITPVTVTLGKEEYSAVTENLELILKAGFEVEDFGTGMVIVRSCPMIFESGDVEKVIMEFANELITSSRLPLPEKAENLYHTAACRAAIKAGDKTSTFEMESLTRELLSRDDVRYCPHGRPVIIEMTRHELEKTFGRIG